MTSLTTSGQRLSQKKLEEMPPPTASGGISRERFEQGPPNCTDLSATVDFTTMLDMTALATSGWLQN